MSLAPGALRACEVRFSRPVAPAGSLSFGLLVLFFLCLYANPALLFPALDAVRPTQLVAMTALAMLVLERVSARRGFDLIWPETHLVAAFVGAAALSCLTAFWSRLAFENLLDLGKFVAVYLLMTHCIDSDRRLRIAMSAMAVGGLFPALGAAHNYINGVVVEGTRSTWVGIFGNPNDLATALVLLVPMGLALAPSLSPWLRPAAWAMVAVFIGGVLLTFSRSGIMGLMVVLALSGLRYAGRLNRLLALGFIGTSILFISLYWSRGDGFSNLSQDFTVYQRLTTVRVGLAMFQDHPLLGVGLGCSVIGWPLYAPADLSVSGRWLHNHNTFVQVLSETGIVGFIPFVLLLLAAWIDIRRVAAASRASMREGRARLAGGLEVSLCGFAVCAMAGGLALSWFPYLLVGAIAAAKKIHLSDPGLPGFALSEDGVARG